MLQNKVGEQKWFNLFGLFNLIIYLLGVSLSAQSFQDFKRVQTLKSSQYFDKKDTLFSMILKKQWEEFISKDIKTLYEKKKPHTIAVSKEKSTAAVGPRIHLKIEKKFQSNEEVIATEELYLDGDIKINFYGVALFFKVNEGVKHSRYFPHNQEGIISYFSSIAKSNYIVTLEEIQKIQKELALNDWGVYLLVRKVALKTFENEDEVKLFTWFILTKMGYNIKIGLSGRSVVLMHYSEKVIYNLPCYTFNGKNFYVLDHYTQGTAKRVYTYKEDYPLADKPINLTLSTLPKLGVEIQKKTLSFEEYGKVYTFNIEYNKNIIDFMATYPQVDSEIFFNAPMEERTYLSLQKGIKKYIDAKHMSEGINFLLHFVQNAFVYEVDDLQFGREKMMFAEEILYYDKSDCEDRAILFSYLVRRLLGITTLGVKYTDHMVTALYIPIEGDSVKILKKRYLIADPSYINANVGISMPKYKIKIPKAFIYIKRDY